MQCNGCGGEFDTLGGFVGYGGPSSVSDIHNRAVLGKDGMWTADYVKTLCPRCQHVLKDILKSSDLSKHWHKYEWSLMGNSAYTEGYDD